MKKHTLILSGLVAVAMPLLSSCMSDKDFLTEDPKNIYVKENAFEKASQLDAALVRAYIKFDEMNAFSNAFMGGEGSSNILHGDGSDVLGGTRGAMDAATGFSNYWSLQTNNGNFMSLWTSLYQLISYGNLVLDGMTLVDNLATDDATYIEAQARFFIGWGYLRLAEMFGGVPIQEQFSEELKFDYERASRADTYSYAIQNLETAASGLPAMPRQNGRAGRGIANHFLAEAYLGRGIETGSASDFDKAISLADAVINAHPMMTARFGARSNPSDTGSSNGVPNYRADGTPYFDLFVKGNYSNASGNTESLMVYNQPEYAAWSVNGGNLLMYAITCGPAYRDLAWNPTIAAEHEKVGASTMPWMSMNIDESLFPGGPLGIHLTGSWGMIGATDYSDEVVWEGSFAEDDRNNQNVRYNPVVMDMKSPYYLQVVTKDQLAEPASLSRVSGKYTTFDLWGWDVDHCAFMGVGVRYCYQYGRDWYIARSAETYLLRAEAKFRKGDTAGATADINAVRARANATKMYGEGEVDLFTILDERARELAWEELRWPTLLRMGGNGSNDVMKRQLEKHSLSTEDVPVFAGQTFPEWTLFPIPFDVIALNSGAELTQNPGWK